MQEPLHNADDITLLAPSVRALHGMAALCEDYAKRFDDQFNAEKRMLKQFLKQVFKTGNTMNQARQNRI